MKSSILLADDLSGSGAWRMTFQANLLWPTLSHDESITVSKLLPPDPNFFSIQNSVMIQRFSTPAQRQLFDKAIFPAAQGGMTNIIYNIDDCMSPDEIPMFNPAWNHYSRPEIQANVKHMLDRSDFVIVTTHILKKYYYEKFNIPLENIIVIPNLMPRSWAFGFYNNTVKTDKFRAMTKSNKRVRVGLISSSSHFNVNGVKQTKDTKQPLKYDNVSKQYKLYATDDVVDENNIEDIPDDIDDIEEVIRKTSDKIEWVSIGRSATAKFQKLVDDGCITIVAQTDILHYMQLISTLDLAAIVAPVKDNLFNWCKSDIKYLEAAAHGAVLYTPDVKPYTSNVPDKQRWTSNDDLVDKLYKLTKTSAGAYSKMIQHQYDFLNKPFNVYQNSGSLYFKNHWLDDNIDIWKSVYFMPRKGLKVHLSSLLAEKPSCITKCGPTEASFIVKDFFATTESAQHIRTHIASPLFVACAKADIKINTFIILVNTSNAIASGYGELQEKIKKDFPDMIFTIATPPIKEGQEALTVAEFHNAAVDLIKTENITADAHILSGSLVLNAYTYPEDGAKNDDEILSRQDCKTYIGTFLKELLSVLTTLKRPLWFSTASDAANFAFGKYFTSVDILNIDEKTKINGFPDCMMWSGNSNLDWIYIDTDNISVDFIKFNPDYDYDFLSIKDCIARSTVIPGYYINLFPTVPHEVGAFYRAADFDLDRQQYNMEEELYRKNLAEFTKNTKSESNVVRQVTDVFEYMPGVIGPSAPKS